MNFQKLCCFPEEIFENSSIIKDLICPIDLNIPHFDNIVIDIHGHSKLQYQGLCKICIKEWLKIKSTCPVTNQQILKNQLYPQQLFSKNILSALRVHCTNKALGCNWKGEFCQIINHLNLECEQQIYQCQNIGCLEFFTANNQKKHLTICNFFILTCQRCHCYYKRQQFKKHKQICLKQKINCHYCGRNYQIDKINAHIRICSDSFVRCYICKVFIQRSYYQEHFQQNFNKHSIQQNTIVPKLLQFQEDNQDFCRFLILGYLNEKYQVKEINQKKEIIIKTYFFQQQKQIIQIKQNLQIQISSIQKINPFEIGSFQNFNTDLKFQSILIISKKIIAGYNLNKLIFIQFQKNFQDQINQRIDIDFESPINCIFYEINLNQLIISYDKIISVIQLHKFNKEYKLYQVQELKEHQSQISCLKSLQNGKHFISGGIDGKLVIWNAYNLSFNNAFIIRVNKIIDQIICLETIENKNFLSGTKNGIITMWNLYGFFFIQVRCFIYKMIVQQVVFHFYIIV